MAKPSLDREIQAAQIMASASYQSGESFTSAVIASLLNVTVGQSRDLLNHLTTTGQLVKRQDRARRGASCSGTMIYQKPPSMILRKAWRIRTDEQIGIHA